MIVFVAAQGGDALGEAVKLLNSIRETNGFLGLITFMLVASIFSYALNQFRRSRQSGKKEEAEAQRATTAEEAADKQFNRFLDIITADREAAREERQVQAARDREHNAQIGRLAESISASVEQMAAVVSSFGELRESVDTSLVAAAADRDAAAASRQQLQAQMVRTNTALDENKRVIEQLEARIEDLVLTIKTDCSRDYTPQLTVITDTMLEIQRQIVTPAIPAPESTQLPGNPSSET